MLAGTSFSDTWTVDDDGPADFDNIQDAVNVAIDGDEILVKPGMYTGSGDQVIDMMGKSITLKATEGLGKAVIDGQMIRRGIMCQSGETTLTVIQGFTIRECRASWYDWNENGNADGNDNENKNNNENGYKNENGIENEHEIENGNENENDIGNKNDNETITKTKTNRKHKLKRQRKRNERENEHKIKN